MKTSVNKKYCVYMHINTINSKRYVGITSKIPEERWRNGNGYKSNKHFYNAILKYGWNNFQHIIVKNNIEMEEACQLEKELIKKYHSNNTNFGYNICDGGETNILPKSSLEKISKKNLGRKMTKCVLEKRAKNPPKAVKVICDGKEFISIIECAKFYNVPRGNMDKWIHGIEPMDEMYKNMELHIKGKKYIYKECYSKRKRIFYKNEEFNSIAEFSRAYEISYNILTNWIYGRKKIPESYIKNGFVIKPKKQYIIEYLN